MDTQKIYTTSFQEMLELFPPRSKLTNIGGCPRRANTIYFSAPGDYYFPIMFRDGTYHDPHNGQIYKSPNYHVECSYNEQQLPYIQRTITLLDGLVQGQIVEIAVSGDKPQKVKSLSEIVVESFRSSGLFGTSLQEAMIHKIKEFGELYPNFIPALNELVVSNVGDLGISAALDFSSFFLSPAVSGYLNQENHQDMGIAKLKNL